MNQKVKLKLVLDKDKIHDPYFVVVQPGESGGSYYDLPEGYGVRKSDIRGCQIEISGPLGDGSIITGAIEFVSYKPILCYVKNLILKKSNPK